MHDTLDFQSALDQFIGTEQYHFSPLYPWLKYTDGVKFFANNAGNGAYWFLAIIGTEFRKLAQQQDFLTIDLVSLDGKAVINVTDGNDNKLKSKRIAMTDCPAGTWRFFLCGDVLMLASEY